MSDSVAGLCRLTVKAPDASFELGVPVDVTLADLLPVLVDHGGGDLHDQGLEHGGWTVQRLGQAPLDEEGTPRSLDLRDGETLYLRARNETLPEVAVDDIVAGVAEVLRGRGDTWNAGLARRVLLGLAVAALAGGLATLALPGTEAVRAGVAAGMAVLLVLCAAAASRAVGDAGGGGALGVMAVPYLALAGALAPTGAGHETMTGARLLAAGAAGAGASVLALAAVAACAPLFLGAFTAALLAAAGGVAVACGLSLPQAAAVVAVLAVVVGGLVPGLAFRMSGLRLPLLPSNAEQLQEGIEPHAPQFVASRAALADGYLTALYAALGLVTAACATVLLSVDRTGSAAGWPVPVLVLVLSALLLLHARNVGSLWQRLSLVVPGGYGPLLAAVLAAVHGGMPERLLLVAVLAVAAAAAAIAAWTVPGRRLVPYWGRIGDLLQTTCAVMLVPLVVLIAGAYHHLRGLKG
ncbi:type VII secretion integral membrane protein EccD [Actinacidiphila yeochonensis]|uniref:type VII secretion integral membrane protein EccD n=1 Tax=Actinacidiphila yeochonensis TaxID=89050 RepID=UPI0005670B42|nr:type VII secretion integral membrane protein EccD [Actinacidiphila yeochonensis]